MQWFRWYQGSCEDGKFRVTARNAGVTVATVMGVWAMLLEDASHPDHRGVAVKGEDYYAAVLDLSPGDVEAILAAMNAVGLVSVGIGAITINRWKERQFETDTKDATNADRQRRHREKRRQDANGGGRNGSVTERNGSVTAAKRPDTDTDTDTDITPPVVPPSGGDGARKVSKGSRISEDWTPNDEDRRFAAEQGFDGGQIRTLADQFRDYWTAATGQKATKRDWSATWRNWLRTDIERNGPPDKRRKASTSGSLDWFDREFGALPAEPAERELH